MDNNSLNFKTRLSENWIYPKIWIYDNKMVDIESYNQMLKSIEDDISKPVRLYIHIPICKSFCYFCPYYKESFGKLTYDDKKAFYGALVKELEMYAKEPYFQKHFIGTIYFGGGDPALVESEFMDLILSTIYKNFNVNNLTQVTMEGNVLSLLDEEKLKLYKQYNVNRISYGVQTFNERLRKKLLIKPTLKDIDNLVDLINKYGFKDHSIDLMYNIPDQTMDDVVKDIEEAIKLNPMYVDDYAMNLFPNTQFAKVIEGGKYFNGKPSNQNMIDMFYKVMEVFEGHGYHKSASMIFSPEHDEPHDGLKHFLKSYPMLGVGPSARGYINRYNYRNVCNIKDYVKAIESGNYSVEAYNVVSKKEEDERKMVFFPILMKINKNELCDITPFEDQIKNLIDLDYMKWHGDDLILTRKGIMWAGDIQNYLSNPKEKSRDNSAFLKAILNKQNPYNQDSMGISAKSMK